MCSFSPFCGVIISFTFVFVFFWVLTRRLLLLKSDSPVAAGEVVLCFSVRPSEPESERLREKRDAFSGKQAALFCDFTHVDKRQRHRLRCVSCRQLLCM